MAYPDPRELSRLLREAEADYSLRPRHPEREAIYADYAARSERLRQVRGCRSLRYAGPERCTIDWFGATPEAGRKPPLLVFFHGGFWRAGDKSVFSFIAEPFLDAGISVALVGYGLAPATTVTAMADQARTAIGWLFDQADTLGFDRERLTVSGHSAGAHLAALLGAEDEGAFGGCSVAGVIGLSGLYALQAFLLCSINLDTRMSADEAEALSPASLPRFGARRFLVAVGGRETDGFLQQSLHFSEHLRALGRSQELMVCEGRTHFDLFEEIASPEAPLFHRMRDLLRG